MKSRSLWRATYSRPKVGLPMTRLLAAAHSAPRILAALAALALAGSGGGASAYEYPGGMGGGYIYLKVNRRLTLGGTITANATTVRNRAGTGAGGGILIDAHKFVVEPGAALSAKGGDQTWSGYGTGAGGIIAVWTGHAYTGARNRRSARELVVPAGADGRRLGRRGPRRNGRRTRLREVPRARLRLLPHCPLTSTSHTRPIRNR